MTEHIVICSKRIVEVLFRRLGEIIECTFKSNRLKSQVCRGEKIAQQGLNILSSDATAG